MAQRSLIIIVVLLILISSLSLQAQRVAEKRKASIPSVRELNYQRLGSVFCFSPQILLNVTLNNSRRNNILLKKKTFSDYFNEHKYLTSELIKNSYTQRLGFFCRQEYKFEKYTNIPLRLRLGSLDYTNYLEQKPNTIKPIF